MNNEIRWQTANAKTIKCKDCKFRDRTSVIINGEPRYVGITKAFCDKYPKLKPSEVMYQNADCVYYEKG